MTATGCEPVRLDLRIEAPSARAGKPSRVWFKASLTNSSCSEIQLPTDFLTLGRFTDSAQDENVGFFFETSVPRGAWRPALWKGAARLGDNDTAAVRPYWIDWESPSMFGSGKGLQHIWLAPAATATNLLPSIGLISTPFFPDRKGTIFIPYASAARRGSRRSLPQATVSSASSLSRSEGNIPFGWSSKTPSPISPGTPTSSFRPQSLSCSTSSHSLPAHCPSITKRSA